MRLKHIKLAGFKSFVDPTKVPFEHQMTAIVGPNGCGKSNIIDAVRWVLGESSAKNLRGDSMTDVIFNGANTRKAIGQASVELVFERTSKASNTVNSNTANSSTSSSTSTSTSNSGVFFTQGANSLDHFQGSMADRNEVSIRRVVNRDSVNSYFLNGSKCRRRDITDIFLGTGLGPRSYAIIEQGTISRLIESKPQDLRIFIEEAAGISKYKERRRETETRIRHTRENLARLSDIRAELTLQIDKLHQQAEAAKRFKTLKASERKYKAELAVLRWKKYDQQSQQYKQKVNKKQREVEDLFIKNNQHDIELLKAKQLLELGSGNTSELQQAKLSLSSDVARLEQKIKHNRQQQADIEKNSIQSQQQLLTAQAELLVEEDKLIAINTDVEEKNPELEIVVQQLDMLKTVLQESQTKLQEAQQNWQQVNHQKNEFISAKAQIESKISTQHNLIADISIRHRKLSSFLTDLRARISQPDFAQTKLQQEKLHEQIQQRIDDGKALKLHAEHLQKRLSEHQQQGAEQRGIYQTLKVNLKQSQSQLVAKPDWLIEQSLWLEQQQINQQGAFYQNIKVAQGWEMAVEMVLSPWLQAQIVDVFPEEIPVNTVSLVKSSLTTLHLGEKGLVGKSIVTTNDQKNSLHQGTLAEKVSGEMACIHLLNQVYITENLKQAKLLLKSLSSEASVICQDGTWLGHNFLQKGLLPEGSDNDELCQVNERLKRVSQINTLQDEISQIGQWLNESDEITRQLQNDIENCYQQQEKNSQDFKQQQVVYQQKQQEIALADQQSQHEQQQCQNTLAELDVLTSLKQTEQRKLTDFEQQQTTALQNAPDESKINEFAQQTEKLEQNIQISQSQIHQLHEQRHELAVSLEQVKSQHLHCTNTIIRHKDQITQQLLVQTQQSELQKNGVNPLLADEKQLQKWLQQMSSLDEDLQRVHENLASAQLTVNNIEDEKKKISSRISYYKEQISQALLDGESYRLRAEAAMENLADLHQNLDDVLAIMPESAKEGLWQAHISRLTKDISQLGAINLAAIDEYDTQFERKSFLDHQNDDLTQAITTLESAIAKIDKESRQKFKATFEQVNKGLKELFPKVFGGGSAYLDLTDEDLLNTGVTIMARPPGKKNSTIHLLSGGEKALTALSLVFAIFRLNPAPFCMLDEVDAPLDDANVERFCNLVREMSHTVQFIYISHNKIAMEMASTLTGVTMFEPGVSKMVAVDIEEAIAMAEIS
ncbi:MAG: chromosome segregation protein SMC [Alteromonadaceae bacterium]|nr:chromosome segregation protein SMC [Alteromonadaceae bacterium]